MASWRKEWVEVSGRWPLLIWEKPAICWAPRDPSSLPCQLHTIEFLGTAAAGLLFAWHSRGKVGAAVLKPYPVVRDEHRSARSWDPRGPFGDCHALSP